MSKHHPVAMIAAVVLSAGAAHSQSYTDLPSPMLPKALSPDGGTIVGIQNTGAGDEAVSYDVASGTVAVIGESDATCVSTGAATIGGQITLTGNGGYQVNFAWTDMGTLNTSGLACGGSSVPTGVSYDGQRLIGNDWPNVCVLDAFTFDLGVGTIDSLPKLGSGSTRADCISGDGLTVGGMERFTGTQDQAALWVYDSVAGAWQPPVLVLQGIDFGDGNLDGLGVVRAISADGSVAAIEAGLNSAPHVKLWRSSGTVEDLGPVPGFPTGRPTPTGITADGSMIVGATFGGFFGVSYGFVWTESNGMELADDFFARLGVPFPAGQGITGILGCSADGSRVYGFSGSFPFYSYWTVGLPSWWKYDEGISPVNSLELDGGGSTSLGATFDVTTSNAGGAAMAITVASLEPADLPLFGGRLVIDPTQFQAPILGYALVGGTGTGSVAMPSDPMLAGLTFYMQSAARDSGVWALSNGLRGVIRP